MPPILSLKLGAANLLLRIALAVHPSLVPHVFLQKQEWGSDERECKHSHAAGAGEVLVPEKENRLLQSLKDWIGGIIRRAGPRLVLTFEDQTVFAKKHRGRVLRPGQTFPDQYNP